MPSDGDMGNSEVGHNAIGAGRVFDQGALLVKNAVASGDMFNGQQWQDLTGALGADQTLHLLGLLSDGNVHSHIDIVIAMIKQAHSQGIRKVRLHVLLDGRDVGPTSALEYVAKAEAVLAEINSGGDFDYAIASGGGRLFITMDRYNADWPMVKRGWDVHVKGIGREFPSATEAIETLRTETPGVIDQDLKEFVIVRDGKPVGPIVDGDSVVLFNFRGEAGVTQLAVSETQKYGHVTYFFNGNRSDKFNEATEEYVEITSDLLPFEQRPWMKGGEITDVLLDSISQNKHDFIRVNYPHGDMVGHTGDLLAVEMSVETVDLCLARLKKAIDAQGGLMIVTADHGNADEMYEVDKKTGQPKVGKDGLPKMKTSHTLNPVPCYIYDAGGTANLRLVETAEPLGISSLAATVIKCLGFEPPADYDQAIVDVG